MVSTSGKQSAYVKPISHILYFQTKVCRQPIRASHRSVRMPTRTARGEGRGDSAINGHCSNYKPFNRYIKTMCLGVYEFTR